jgi:hypothetical protein
MPEDQRVTRWSRRNALLTLGASAALAGARGARAARSSVLSPMDTYAKIRCSLEPELVPFWYRGQAMVALQDDVPRASLGVEGFSYTRFTREADGSWMTKLIEVGYFTDLATGAIVDETHNPLNGAPVRPHHFTSPPQLFAVKPDGTMASTRKLPPPSEFAGRVGQPFRQGPEVWVDEDELGRLESSAVPAPLREEGAPAMLVLGSMTTYRARAADVDDPRLANAPCTFHLQELSSLPGRFGMGAVVGKQMWRVSGRKLRDVSEIAQRLRAHREGSPDIHPVAGDLNRRALCLRRAAPAPLTVSLSKSSWIHVSRASSRAMLQAPRYVRRLPSGSVPS